MRQRFPTGAEPSYTMPVSVVIPVLGPSDKLARTLAALCHQTYPSSLVEVIVVGDGSDGEVEGVLRPFQSRLEVGHVRGPGGRPRAGLWRNLGIGRARHDALVLLDADMLPEPALIEAFMRYQHVTDRAALVGHRRFVNAEGLNSVQVLFDIHAALALGTVDTMTGLPVDNDRQPNDWRESVYAETARLIEADVPYRAFVASNVCFHRSLFDAAGPFDPAFSVWGGDDIDFAYRASNEGCYFLPVADAVALRQEPAGGPDLAERERGLAEARALLAERCPRYRKHEVGRRYLVPKVSVCLAVHDDLDRVQQAVDSALDQTFTDLEIVIAEASTDGTTELLGARYGEDARVRVVRVDSGSPAACWNAALRAARGEYLVPMKTSEVLLSSCVERLARVLDRSDVGFVFGDAQTVDAEGDPVEGPPRWSVYDRERLLAEGSRLPGPGMFRARDVRRVGELDESLGGDADRVFAARLSEVATGYHLQTTLGLELAPSRPATPEPAAGIAGPGPNGVELAPALRRLGIAASAEVTMTAEQARELCHPSFVDRQARITGVAHREKLLRLGPFASRRTAIQAAEWVAENHRIDGEIVGERTDGTASYHVLLRQPWTEAEAIGLRDSLLRDHTWFPEVDVFPRPAVRSARTADLRDEYLHWRAERDGPRETNRRQMAMVARGRSRLRAGDVAEALAALAKARDLGPLDLDDQRRLARCLIDTGSVPAGIEVLVDALSEADEPAEVERELRATLAQSTSRHELEVYEALVRRRPEVLPFRERLAALYGARARSADAMALFAEPVPGAHPSAWWTAAAQVALRSFRPLQALWLHLRAWMAAWSPRR